MNQYWRTNRSSQPSRSNQVVIVKHRIDWTEASDLEAITAARLEILGHSISRGAWYLNPGYEVHAPAATSDFFAGAGRIRSAWLKQLRQVLGNRGYRQAVRQAMRRGWRAGLIESNLENLHLSPTGTLKEMIRDRELSDEQESIVRSYGHLAKNLAGAGVMILDGNQVPPWEWERLAIDLKNAPD